MGDTTEEPIKKRSRRSRFEELSNLVETTPATASADVETGVNLAAAHATEIAKSLQLGTNPMVPSFSLGNIPVTMGSTPVVIDAASLQFSIKAAEIQAQVAAQIASVSNLLSLVHGNKLGIDNQTKRAANTTLRLDAQGREIDESGNLVRQELQVKTLVANVAVVQAQKKKENPYLAHRSAPPPILSAANLAAIPASALPYLPRDIAAQAIAAQSGIPIVTGAEVPGLPSAPLEPVDMIDDRLVLTNRDRRGKKSLSFADPGKYIAQADELRIKEERKIIAGYSSGRKAPEVIDESSIVADSVLSARSIYGEGVSVASSSSSSANVVVLPPPSDGGVVPCMEWWDETFLPKTVRENRKKSRAAAETDDFHQLSIIYSKSHKYVQHPVAIRALGGDRPDMPLPMYLTKKERKRIRKTARQERETEKRDKMMMGLIAAPEPKFKLSNFMKVLGDQAVADPSKVELRVLQQMQQRQMNHEMRNQAAKLTPEERSAKRTRKLQEDTTRQVHVAVFRVWNLNSPKHRFKVDVNAQQHFMSGVVLLNQETMPGNDHKSCNIVIVEGGPKGVRKFVKLMTQRIPWNDLTSTNADGEHAHEANPAEHEESDAEEEDKGNDDDDEDDNANDDGAHESGGNSQFYASGNGGGGSGDGFSNKCVLIWQGIVPKRAFTGFKFQDCRTGQVGRKLLEAKSVAHYWDMAANFPDK